MSDDIKKDGDFNDFNDFENHSDGYIENDEFPEVMEENFSGDFSLENDEDDQDFDDSFDELDEIDYSKPTPQSSGINWFNIGVIGILLVGVGAITYSFLPTIFNATQSTQQASAPNLMNNAQQNQELATSIATNGTDNSGSSLFANPSLLEDETDKNAIDETQKGNAVVAQNGNDTQSVSGDDIDELFAAIPDMMTNTPNPPQDDILDLGDIDTLPMPSDASSSMDDFDDVEEPAVVEMAPTQPQEIEAPITTTSEIAVTSTPEPVQTQTTTISPSASNDIEVLNSRIDAMNNQMESFMARLENKLETIGTSSQPTSGAGNSGQLNQLQQTISRLENRLNAIESAPNTVSSSPEPVQMVEPKPVVTMVEEPKPVVTMAEPKTPDVLLPTPEPVQMATAPKRREPAYVPPKVQYDLRGASNGQAVIAQMGTQNLQTVRVGSVVRGIGTIRSIAIENGQWVVRGTSGIVRQ